MKSLLSVVLAASMAVCASSTWAEKAPKTDAGSKSPKIETWGDYLMRPHKVTSRALFGYCAKEVPSLKAELATSEKQFLSNLQTALKGMESKLSFKMSEPVDPGAPVQPDVSGALVEQIKQHPAETYCKALMSNLQKATAEALQGKLEAGYARYEQQAKAAKANATKPAEAAPAPSATPAAPATAPQTAPVSAPAAAPAAAPEAPKPAQ